MDKLREEFEEWVMNISSGCAELSLTIHGTYDSWDVERYWDAWQASRAAIVVELPPINIPSASDTLLKAAIQMAVEVQTNKCAEAIRSIGLSIKGE